MRSVTSRTGPVPVGVLPTGSVLASVTGRTFLRTGGGAGPGTGTDEWAKRFTGKVMPAFVERSSPKRVEAA